MTETVMQLPGMVTVLYVMIVNFISFLFFGWDKSKAEKGSFRISERTLMFLAILGGSIGALAGMYTFRHKTRKLKFRIGIPVILILQIMLAGVLICGHY